MISASQYLAQHAAQAAPGELTDDIRLAADGLIAKVNKLLAVFLVDTGLTRVLRSGWRPTGFNASFMHTDAQGHPIRGGAPQSKHTTGHGVDVADNDGKLDAWLTDEKLAQFELYREAPGSTPSWCHLQDVAPGSGHRTFQP